MLIYKLLGSQAEESFSTDWGTGLAIEQASQWRGIAQSLLVEVAILLVLDQLKVIPVGQWLEEQMDFLSVQATLFHGKGTGWGERMRSHLTFYNRIEM